MAQCDRCGRNLPGLTFGKKICVWCKQHEAAQRGEVSEYQPVMAAPWKRGDGTPMLVTQVFFGINVAVFIGMLLSGGSPVDPSSELLIGWGANYGPYTLTGDWWRLVTSCFVHIGIVHIAMNLWCLWSLGAQAERLYGHATFACIYLLSGISGSLASIFWHHGNSISAGASGAIFGIVGALIASIKLGEFAFSGMAKGLMQSMIMFLGYSVVFGAISGRTDNACHVGGLAAGLVLGALIAKVAPEARVLPRVGVLVLVAAVLGGGGYVLRQSRAYANYMERASEQVDAGKVESALPYYEAALKLRPEAAGTIHFRMGYAYWEQKNLAAAEVEMQKALSAEPKNEKMLYDLGRVRLLQHHTDAARATYEQLLALNPRNAQAFMGLGEVADDTGDYTLALKEFDQAAQANPKLGYVYYSRGKSLARLKQYDEAVAAFRKEIEVNGDDESTERALAEAYKAKGMNAEADAAVKQAEKIKQDQQDQD